MQKSRASIEEAAHARPCGNLERAAPRRGSSSRAAEGRRLARRDSRHQSASFNRRLRSVRGRPRKKTGPAGRLRALRRACSARTDAHLARWLRRACPARTDRALATRTARSSSAQTRASGALSAHSGNARHASPLSHSLCDRHLIHGRASRCLVTPSLVSLDVHASLSGRGAH